jgi:hypothetical protein
MEIKSQTSERRWAWLSTWRLSHQRINTALVQLLCWRTKEVLDRLTVDHTLLSLVFCFGKWLLDDESSRCVGAVVFHKLRNVLIFRSLIDRRDFVDNASSANFFISSYSTKYLLKFPKSG